jgi:ATP-dependent Clp protease ATP-binding subunit ClpB
VVIMTSNIGSHHLLDGVTADGEIKPDARDRVMAELRGHFRPEFLNRVDDIVLFTPLSMPQLERIVELQLAELRDRLVERQIELDISPDARRMIAEHGYDPVYGARPLKRAIQRLVENPLALELLEGRFGEGDTVQVDAVDGELAFERAPASVPAPA